ncbi:MAG TPA: HAD family hydrolase [Polyangiaceae bacterium]|jgi:putative hydrolase of the HAD superfamily|nr:HAD family hydrolase [Polyangiaceae bacterium]
MRFDAVIFDWGGTLSEFAEIDLYDMWKLAAAHLARATGRAEAELTEKLLAAELRYWDGVKESQRTGTLGEILAEESRALGLDVTRAVLEETAQKHLDAWTPHIRHHADAVPALRALRAQGLKLGLLSNTHWPASFHEHFLERDGLLELLDVRAYTSELTHSKPHRVAFEHVLGKLGVVPERAVMVGDRPIDDIWGAQALGMFGIWRPHRASPELGSVRPNAVIQTLAELPELLASL